MVKKFMERTWWFEKCWSKFYCSGYSVTLNNYKVKTTASLRFWENKGWINETDPYGYFQWYFRYFLGRIPSDNFRNADGWKKCKCK